MKLIKYKEIIMAENEKENLQDSGYGEKIGDTSQNNGASTNNQVIGDDLNDILRHARSNMIKHEQEEHEAIEKYLKNPCSIKALFIVTLLLMLAIVLCHNKLSMRIALVNAMSDASMTQVKQDNSELLLRLAELEKKLGFHTMEPTHESSSNISDAEDKLQSPNKFETSPTSISDSGYEITYDRYIKLAPDVRIMLIKEHFRSSSMAIRYFITSLTETNTTEFLKSEAGAKVTRLYAVWTALENDPVALSAIDILITDKKFFNKTFTEAVELGGMAILIEALSDDNLAENTSSQTEASK